MQGNLDFFTVIGLFFILLGALFLLVPLLARLVGSLENVHPLLLWGKRIDGIYIGTSPLLIIILVLVYVALALFKR